MQKFNDVQMTLLRKRYLAKKPDGTQETPEEMFRRVAKNIAQAEEKFGGTSEQATAWEETFYQVMADLCFLPNSPTLMNAGRDLQQLSACFVLPVEDSMESIFDAIKSTALIHQAGGGTGFSFSKLRPTGSPVLSTGGTASGPISFMKVFNSATDVVKQGGRRRGANMAILRIDHPDIRQFVTCKSDGVSMENFNISVAITADFMKAYQDSTEYLLINPKTGQITKENAREIMTLIAQCAWKNGEPGLLFIDTINDRNPVPHLGKIEATNACSELPLLSYESCNLGSINLYRMAVGDTIDWQLLRTTVAISVRFLDNVIEMSRFPLAEIEQATKATRKIGLGVMGFADLLLKLGISYGSRESFFLADDIMKAIQDQANVTSLELAISRGTYPAHSQGLEPPYRNATRTTIAPTGSISMIAGVWGGIEPFFTAVTRKDVLDGEQLYLVSPALVDILKAHELYTPEILDKMSKTDNLASIPELPQVIKTAFVTAHELDSIAHIKMQAVFQSYIDNAVSKTVNMPHDATVQDVLDTYLFAYNNGCKGITVYRHGSRSKQVLNKAEEPKFIPIPRPRAEVLTGVTVKTPVGCGNLYVTINEDDNGVAEVFTRTGKSTGCSSQSEAIGRLVSLALRSGIPAEHITEQLRGIRCSSCIRREGIGVLSCPDAMARALEKTGSREENKISSVAPLSGGQICPECGKESVNVGRCWSCVYCGNSKCG